MPCGLLEGSKSWLLKGRRRVLKPACAIWSSISCQLRARRPWGEKVRVSKPNQLTPIRRTSHPDASSSLPWKLVERHTGSLSPKHRKGACSNHEKREFGNFSYRFSLVSPI